MSKKDASKDTSSREVNAVMCYGWKLDTADAAVQMANVYAKEHPQYAELTVEIALVLLHAACITSAKGTEVNIDALPNLLSAPEISLSDTLTEELEMLQAIYADQCSHAIKDGTVVSLLFI